MNPSLHVQFILDTNILVMWIRGKASFRTLDTLLGLTLKPSRFAISIVTIGEIKSLALKWNWGAKRLNRMENLLKQFIRFDISKQPILDAYAELDFTSDRMGRRMGKNDLWIAATANFEGLTLLTTDIDFDHLRAAGHINRLLVDANGNLLT